MWRIIEIAFRNLKRNKRRNLSTGIAIALGFCGLLLLFGYVYRAQNYLRVYTIYGTRNGHLAIYKREGLQKYTFKPEKYSLSPAEQTQIRTIIGSMSNVEFHGAHLLGTGLIGNGCKTLPFMAFGVDAELAKRINDHPELAQWAPRIKNFIKGQGIWNYPQDIGPLALSSGLVRLLNKPKVLDELPKDQLVVVADCLAEDAKGKIAGDANVQLASGTWDGRLSAVDGEVVAHYNTGQTETNNAAILAPIQRLQALYETENATFHSIFVKDVKQLTNTFAEVKAKAQAAGLDVEIYRWESEELNPFYSGTMSFLYTMVGFLVCVLCAVIVFAILNSATMTVIERSQEIGMLRAMGFTKRRIRIMYLLEILILAGISLVAGGILAMAAMAIVNVAKIEFNPPGVSGGMQLLLIPNLVYTMVSAVTVVSLAIFATWLAVKSIARKNIAGLLLGTAR